MCRPRGTNIDITLITKAYWRVTCIKLSQSKTIPSRETSKLVIYKLTYGTDIIFMLLTVSCFYFAHKHLRSNTENGMYTHTSKASVCKYTPKGESFSFRNAMESKNTIQLHAQTTCQFPITKIDAWFPQAYM